MVFVVAAHYQSLQIIVLLLQACLLGSLALSRIVAKGKVKTSLHGLPMWFLWLRRILSKSLNYSFALTNMCFRDLPLLSGMIKGFLKFVFSRGWFSMKLQFSITIRLSFFTAGWYAVTKGNILLCFPFRLRAVSFFS